MFYTLQVNNLQWHFLGAKKNLYRSLSVRKHVTFNIQQYVPLSTCFTCLAITNRKSTLWKKIPFQREQEQLCYNLNKPVVGIYKRKQKSKKKRKKTRSRPRKQSRKKNDNGQEKKKVIMLSTKKKRKFFFLGRFLGRDHVFFLFFLLSCFLL